MHHLTDVPGSLAETARVLAANSTFVCEYANKRNLKAILRYILRCQDWLPFEARPVEFGPAYYNYHPRWIAERLSDVGLRCEKRRAVSAFRTPWLKRTFSPSLLATADGLLQAPGGLSPLTPSVFLRAVTSPGTDPGLQDSPFRCARCNCTDLHDDGTALRCSSCGHSWPIIDGVYDFGAPMPHRVAASKLLPR